MTPSWKYVRAIVAAMSVSIATMAVAAGDKAVLVRFGNGEVLTEQDLSELLSRRVDMRQAGRNMWGVQAALRELALNRALVLEGTALGEPRNSGKESARFDDAYSLAVYKKLSPSCEPPADGAAARQFFDANPQVFSVPPMARLSRIMLPVGISLDGEPAMGWLMQQAQAVGSGGRKFDDVAERAAAVYKLDPQGDLGWVTLTDDVTILRALAAAKAGDMVGPVREGDFAYLFSVVAKRESRQLAWEDVAASAPNRMVRYCREQGSKQLQERLFAKYGVELDQAAIQGLFNRVDAKK